MSMVALGMMILFAFAVIDACIFGNYEGGFFWLAVLYVLRDK